jgi:cytochrome P450
MRMNVLQGRVPLGPQQKFRVGEDLLQWMGRHFDTYGDIYSASVYGSSAYVTRDVEFAHHTLVENWHNYVKGQYIARVGLLLGKGLMVSKGELWRRQRRMIQPGFNADSVSTSAQLITSVNAKLLEKWQLAASKHEGVNVTRDVSSMALEVVLRFIFGKDYDRVETYFHLLSAEPARNMQFATSFRTLGKIIHEIVQQRGANVVVSDDILSLLMEARDPDSGRLMPEAQLIDEVLTLIVAGHETTASTLNWCWYLISQHPEVEQKLWSELEKLPDSLDVLQSDDLAKFPYTRQILDETMRLYPAGWMVSRKALQDDQLGEYFVPAGTEIYVAIYFMQRHPTLWKDPDQFDPERFAPEHSRDRHRLATIPFSAGPRNCIGALFARTEMQIHLMTIARNLRLLYASSKPVELDAGVNLRSRFDFIMHPELKNPVLRKAG